MVRTAVAGLSLFALVLGFSVASICDLGGTGHWSRALALEEAFDDSRSARFPFGLEPRSSQDSTGGGQPQASTLLPLDLDCEPTGGDDLFCVVISLRDIDVAKLRLRVSHGDGVRNLLHARSRSDFSRAPPQRQA